jgi:hypothetical protein
LSGYSGNAYYLTTGTSPNRIFTVEMRNWLWNYGASTPSISIQIKLLEGTNKIQFIYRQESGSVSSASASIGLTSTNTGSGSFLSLNGSGTSPSVSSITETSSIATRPATGQIYEFTPVSCVGPSTMTFTKVNPTTVNVSFSSLNIGDTFYLEYGIQGFTRGTGTVVFDTSKASGVQKTITGLSPIFYHFYVFEKCSATDTSLVSGPHSLDNTADLNYLFRAYADTFRQLSGGTSLSAIETDDNLSGTIPIGFPFEFHGALYTKMKVSSNGWATFDTNATSNMLANDLSNSQSDIRPLVAPLWDDLSGSYGTATYLTTGTAPNRVFTIQCIDWLWNYGASTASISYQIKLYETLNKINFVYREEMGSVQSASASIGIAAKATGTGKFQSLSSSGTNPSVSNISETDNISTRPATGQVYEFRPDTTGDVGVIALISPDSGICGTNKMPVKVAIRNFGNNPQSYIPIEVRVSGAHTASLSYLYTGTLLPHAIDTVLVGLLNAASGGIHNILAYTNAPGETDRADDSLRVVRGFSPGLSVDLGNDTSYCANTIFSYSLNQSAPPGASYLWQDNSAGSSFTATAPGIYWLELTSGVCKASDTIRITTDTVPVIVFSTLPNQCLNYPILLLNTATPVGGTYSGTGVVNSAFFPGTAGTGTHTIQYSFTDSNHCTGIDSATVLVDTLPQVSFTSPAPLCQSSTLFQLTTGMPAGGYYSGPRVSAGYYVPNKVGTDTLRYIRIGANNCRDTAKAAIRVVAEPIVSLSTFPALCDNSAPHTFTEGTPLGGTYAGTGVTAGSFNPKTSGAGSYTISYAYTDSNNCSATAYKTLTVNPKPNVTFTPSLDTCAGGNTITLNGGSPAGGIYSGQFVSGGLFDPASSGVGVFNISYAYTDNLGCADSATANLEIFANPTSNLPDSAVACPKESITLDAGNSGSTYLWNTGDIGQTLSPSLVGYYSVTVTSTQGCESRDTAYISFIEVCAGISTVSKSAGYKVFPNPANEELHIDFNAQVPEITHIRILSYTGTEVFNLSLSEIEGSSVRLNLKGITSGSYLLEIGEKNGWTRQKVMVVH